MFTDDNNDNNDDSYTPIRCYMISDVYLDKQMCTCRYADM